MHAIVKEEEEAAAAAETLPKKKKQNPTPARVCLSNIQAEGETRNNNHGKKYRRGVCVCCGGVGKKVELVGVVHLSSIFNSYYGKYSRDFIVVVGRW